MTVQALLEVEDLRIDLSVNGRSFPAVQDVSFAAPAGHSRRLTGRCVGPIEFG